MQHGVEPLHDVFDDLLRVRLRVFRSQWLVMEPRQPGMRAQTAEYFEGEDFDSASTGQDRFHFKDTSWRLIVSGTDQRYKVGGSAQRLVHCRMPIDSSTVAVVVLEDRDTTLLQLIANALNEEIVGRLQVVTYKYQEIVITLRDEVLDIAAVSLCRAEPGGRFSELVQYRMSSS